MLDLYSYGWKGREVSSVLEVEVEIEDSNCGGCCDTSGTECLCDANPVYGNVEPHFLSPFFFPFSSAVSLFCHITLHEGIVDIWSSEMKEGITGWLVGW
jgi:hypothetical protein